MATAIAPLLRNYGFEVVMYDQKNDAYKVLKNGGSLPLSGVGYVIELHLNAAANDSKGNGKTTGVEVLVHTGETGITVEQAICRRIAALGFTSRGVKRRGDLLVMNTVHRKGISHALIETCFVDDADDMKLYKATYSKTTYTTRQVADGYQATAVYKGEVEKTGVGSVIYTVTYTGSKIPVLPGLDPDITVSQLAIATGLVVLLILLLIWRYIRWHIARVYVYNEERRIHDVVSRQYVRVRTPKIRLAALQGHEETEYTVILRKRLAKRLVGRDIAIETGGEGQHHVVESFVGSDYAFQVQI